MANVLTQEQIDFYRQNGFLHVENALTEDEVDELASYMDEAMEETDGKSVHNSRNNGSYYRVLNQKVNTWRDHAGMGRYATHPRISRMALELSGANGIRLFHDHALWKMPQDSKPTPWHQDFPYWPMNESGALSAWIPMHDVDEHNGCMMFVPGSHKAGKLTGINLAEPENIFDFVKGTEFETRKPVIVPLKKGSLTFHNGLTFHAAGSNMSDAPRRVLAIIFMPDGTTYNGKPHLCTNGQNFVENEPLHGGLFPLLAKA
ncbi:phytanoyl-CoA dioxygenase family protein [Paenibacillus cymbidii]|uniref:phytanoyl-CoA dioxygenase family protein n=1 Tax=Paenibacillus cymbidii TaxID=1639034 RepID=UPI0010800EF6|nr:phytanoyl-CoA dioxygenase family protein [Paenibacillus cymbidii]